LAAAYCGASIDEAIAGWPRDRSIVAAPKAIFVANASSVPPPNAACAAPDVVFRALKAPPVYGEIVNPPSSVPLGDTCVEV
jgi:hypothetical protein